jgi:hypothetical protein
VRLRVRKAAAEVEEVLNQMASKAAEQGEAPVSPFAEITDEDIDALFTE